MDGGVKSPFFVMTDAEVVADLDRVFDPLRYQNVYQYRDVLMATAIKNPEQMQLYLEAIKMRYNLIRTVIEESRKPEVIQQFNGGT